ncbi:PGF-CTERM sorting domain-containing protein [Halomicrococcus gelatinilyticus]|uniref:PGF-CTERM sorting domain-containing protein n=1 Tax=Halomicrococcus gelatinilyticus TaxID=1702103 RepID=UPI002E13E265
MLITAPSAGVVGAQSAGAGTGDSAGTQIVQADDGDVYLVFGANPADGDLESWVEEHKDQASTGATDTDGQSDSDAQVIQYQDVDQLNVHQKGKAVAISIDGGQARAIQRAVQNNYNTQSGEAESTRSDAPEQSVTFEDVDDVNIIFANDDGSTTYSGWVVENGDESSSSGADASVIQDQDVDQLNYNNQSTALAIAENGSNATAIQRSIQRNVNVQEGVANASNAGHHHGGDADSAVAQLQDVDQRNVNLQGSAIAIAVGENSTAKAVQFTQQTNINAQVASASANSYVPMTPIEFVATAGIEPSSDDVETSDSSDSTDSSDSGQANLGAMHADGDDGDGHEHDGSQGADARVLQYQNVSQQNINMQNAATAIALNNSTATAYQTSYQSNYNSQIGAANATNVENSTTALYNSDETGDRSTWSVDYDNGHEQTNEQMAAADVSQLQYVEQVNVNQQYNALAVAENDGEATALQVTYQSNENRQVAESNASDGTESPGHEHPHDGGHEHPHDGGQGHEHPHDDSDHEHPHDDSSHEHPHDSTSNDEAGSQNQTSSDPANDSTTDSSSAADESTTTTTTTESDPADTTSTDSMGAADDDSTTTTTSNDGGQPGFGVAIAVVALLAAAMLTTRRGN